MYGSNPFATVPFAALASSVLFVGACIHVNHALVYTATISATVC